MDPRRARTERGRSAARPEHALEGLAAGAVRVVALDLLLDPRDVVVLDQRRERALDPAVGLDLRVAQALERGADQARDAALGGELERRAQLRGGPRAGHHLADAIGL